MGYDSDHPLAAGEVGRVGVAIDSLEDMAALFDGIPLDRVSTSMTINATAIILLALYIAVAQAQGVDARGAVRHDPERHPEGVHRARHLHLPAARRRCGSSPTSSRSASASCRNWNTISISGYHIREAGSTAVQEVAFTLRQRHRLRRGGRSTPGSTSNRSASGCRSSSTRTTTSSRRSPSSARRGGCGRASCATGSARPTRARSSCASTRRPPAARSTAQQPDNNIVRVALQALAAVLGGTQSLHCNGTRRGAGAADRGRRRASRCARSRSSPPRPASRTPSIRSAARTPIEALTERDRSRTPRRSSTRIDARGRHAGRDRDRAHSARDSGVGLPRAAGHRRRRSRSSSASTGSPTETSVGRRMRACFRHRSRRSERQQIARLRARARRPRPRARGGGARRRRRGGARRRQPRAADHRRRRSARDRRRDRRRAAARVRRVPRGLTSRIAPAMPAVVSASDDRLRSARRAGRRRRRRVSFEIRRGRDAGAGRRIRAAASRSPRSRSCGWCSRPAASRGGRVRFKGRDLLTLVGARDARGARRRDRAHLSGADDGAQPGLHGRRSDRRGAARPRPAPRRREARDRAVELLDAVRIPNPRARVRRLSASAVGRHAAARDDRDGAGLPPVAGHRRRADDRARRHHPGADPRPAARDEGAPSTCRCCSSPTTSASSPRRPTASRSCTRGRIVEEGPVRDDLPPAAASVHARAAGLDARRTPASGCAPSTAPSRCSAALPPGCAFTPRCPDRFEPCMPLTCRPTTPVGDSASASAAICVKTDAIASQWRSSKCRTSSSTSPAAAGCCGSGTVVGPWTT